jgi:DNA-binding beta-propeller fold protein YncE
MGFGRWPYLILAVALLGSLGQAVAQAGPLAVVANFTDPGLSATGPPWPPGTVSIIDTATDKQVGAPLQVGANPMAVAITPDGKTAVVACTQSSELYFIDLSANPPAITGKLSVGTGTGDTFYPAGLAMSPDGQFVAVTSSVGGQQRSTQIQNILVVNVKEHTLVQTLGLQEAGVSAEAAAINAKGSIVIVGPSSKPPVIFALSYVDGSISLPEAEDPNTQLGTFQNATGFNVTLSPDGSYALIPLGGSKLDMFRIDDAGKLTVGKELIDSGGDGAHSVAITADGKTAYVRNLLPPRSNIAVFQIDPGPELKDTGQRLNCPGIPQAVTDLSDYQAGALGFVGSQMVAVTPDSQKIYAPNPFGGPPEPRFLGLYGAGNLLVFQAGNPTPVKTLTVGQNPIAVAIQSK